MPNYTKDITPGKNLGFKVGPQSKIDAIITAGTGAVEGVFYLTYDTHKLYIGVKSGSVTPVNEGVVTVSEVAALPPVTAQNKAALIGSFYYASKENILCVYNGDAWAQINTDTYLVSSKFATSDVSGEDDLVKVNNLLQDSSGSHPVQDSFYVQGANGVKVRSAVRDNDRDVIEVEGDTYTLSADTAQQKNSADVTFNLTSKNVEGNNSAVTLHADKFANEDSNAIEFEKTDGENIVVKVRDTVNKSLAIAEKADGGFTITVTDSYNTPVHDTVDPTIKYGLNGQNVAHFLSGQAVLDILSKDDFNEAMRVLNAMTYRGTIGTNGSAGADIEKVGGYDAIVKSDGTVYQCRVGDMFVVSTPDTVTYNGDSLAINTLLIARNKNAKPDESGEDDDGFIPAADLAFDVIASTIDTDTQYIFDNRNYSNTNEAIGANGAGITLQAKTGNVGPQGVFEIGAVKSAGTAGSVDQETGIEVSVDTSKTTSGTNGGVHKSVILKHGKTLRQDTALTDDGNYSHPNEDQHGSVITIPAVVAVETNASGHVVGIKTQNFEIRDTNTTLTSVALTTGSYEVNDGINNVNGKSVGVLTDRVTVTTGYNKPVYKEDSFVFSSETLHIESDSTLGATAGGTAQAGLSINMLWGSFE